MPEKLEYQLRFKLSPELAEVVRGDVFPILIVAPPGAHGASEKTELTTRVTHMTADNLLAH